MAPTLLSEKGLIVKNEKRDGLSKIPIYDLAANVAEKIGKAFKEGFADELDGFTESWKSFKKTG